MRKKPKNHDALLQRGRDYIRARREFVREGECLQAIIMTCIDEGCKTRDDIIRTVPKFANQSYRTVAVVLDEGTGTFPDRHYWFRDDDKTYHLHGSSARPAKAQRKPRSKRRREAENDGAADVPY